MLCKIVVRLLSNLGLALFDQSTHGRHEVSKSDFISLKFSSTLLYSNGSQVILYLRVVYQKLLFFQILAFEDISSLTYRLWILLILFSQLT